MKTNPVEEIINAQPKMIASAYKPALDKINDIFLEMLSFSDFTSIDFANSCIRISDIIDQYRIPYNIYTSGMSTEATVLCTLVKWSIDKQLKDDTAYYKRLVSSVVAWTVLVHIGIYAELTPDDYPYNEAIKDIIDTDNFSSIEKLLIISRAISYFNPNEPNPELWPNDPKVMEIIAVPQHDRAIELTRQLFTAPNNQEAISKIADELIELYKVCLKN